MKFKAGKIYHLYNRGNNSQKIFFERDNYLFFLQKVRTHLKPIADILAYCLMPNHFHILIAVPNNHSITEEEISKSLQDSVAVILRSYTRAINKKFDRTGSLFQMGTKAKDTEDYAFECFHYIHQNPIRSKLVNKLDHGNFHLSKIIQA